MRAKLVTALDQARTINATAGIGELRRVAHPIAESIGQNVGFFEGLELLKLKDTLENLLWDEVSSAFRWPFFVAAIAAALGALAGAFLPRRLAAGSRRTLPIPAPRGTLTRHSVVQREQRRSPVLATGGRFSLADHDGGRRSGTSLRATARRRNAAPTSSRIRAAKEDDMNALPTSIRSLVNSEMVTELQLWYTDELGELEIVTLAGDGLDTFMTRGVAHNDPDADYPTLAYGSDIVAVPDWHTFRMLPQTTHGPSAAAVFCCLESSGFIGLDDFVLQ